MVTYVCAFVFFFSIWEYVKNALFRCGLKKDQCSPACVYVHKYCTETHICDLFSHVQPEDILVNSKPCTWQWSHKLIMPGYAADANMRMNSSKHTFLVMYALCKAMHSCVNVFIQNIYTCVQLCQFGFLKLSRIWFVSVLALTDCWPPPLNWYWAHTPGFHPLC